MQSLLLTATMKQKCLMQSLLLNRPVCVQMEEQSDGDGNDSGGVNGVYSNPELRWSSQRRLRAPTRKRDRDQEVDDTDM